MNARFPRFRRVVEGQPVIVVHNGELQREAMRVERISVRL
ncbi:MAG: YetF domain-containing protein [Pseudonocardiaceae bacterium]